MNSGAPLLVGSRLHSFRRAVLWIWATVPLWVGCGPGASPIEKPPLAVTTSYLEAVARDLLGEEVSVLLLAEPGTCPGHFDLRPRQAQALQRCRALLRFNFQKSLDERLAGKAPSEPFVMEVSARGGLGLPATYLAACRQVADRLVALGWVDPQRAALRLEAIAARLQTLERQLARQVAEAGLAGLPVLVSDHQREFCEWLGLRVAGTFRAADAAGIRALEAAWRAGQTGAVRGVIANRPEGTQAAEALAARLQVPVVVFDNFPAHLGGGARFDQMLTDNVRALRSLARP